MLAGDLMHLNVLAPEHPFERHIVGGFVTRDGAPQHPMTDEPVEEGVRWQGLTRETTGD